MSFMLYFYSFWWLFLVLGSLDCQVSMKCLVVTCNKSYTVSGCIRHTAQKDILKQNNSVHA